MSPVTLPPGYASAGSPSSAMPALQPGAVIPALVLGPGAAGMLRLQIPGGLLDVTTDGPLAAGTLVELAVSEVDGQRTITLTPLPGGPVSAPEVGAPGAPASQAAALPLVSSPATAPPADLNTVLQSVVTTIMRDAAGRQNGMAPLYADLQAALTQPDANMPAPVRVAVEQLLALRLDPGTGVDAAAVKSALLQAGLAAVARGDASVAPDAAMPDLKTALMALRQTLKGWLDSEPASAPSAPQMAARLPAPLPPYRNSPTVPQAAAAASVADLAAPRDVATRLLAETDAALARHTLLQIASLPDQPAGGAGRADASSARLTFDIPLATAQGTAVAQIRIERDGEKRRGADIRPVWRVSFSVDVEPIGPVHARIALTGEHAAVSLYAERPDSAERLRRGLPLLEAGLKDAAFEPGEILCRAGTPAVPPAAPGLFVDHAS